MTNEELIRHFCSWLEVTQDFSLPELELHKYLAEITKKPTK